MDIAEVSRAELLDQIEEDRFGVAVHGVIERADRREPYADAAPVPNLQNRVGDFKGKTGPVLDRLAIVIGALVHPIFQKLIYEIAVRAVNLDAVESRPFGVFRRSLIVGDDAGDVLHTQSARFRSIGETRFDEGFRLRRDGGWRHRQRDMRHAPDMPKLDEYFSACLMHGLGHFCPAFGLCLAIDPGRPEIALALF